MSTTLGRSIEHMISLEKTNATWSLEVFRYDEETKAGLQAIASKSFNKWQFEKLLNSATDLLDRAIQSRTKLRELEAQMLAFRQACAGQGQAIEAEEDGLSPRTLSFEGGTINQEILLGAPSKGENELRIKRLQKAGSELADGTQEMEQAVASALNLYDHGEENDTKLQHRIQYRQANSELSRLKAGETQNFLAIDVSRIAILASELEVNNRRDALKLAKEQLAERIAAASDQGPLNYQFEISIWFDVMRRDFLEASARLYAAVEGINDAFGVLHFYEPSASTLADAVLDASKFARQLNYWLALATQHDQSFTICIPLHERLSDEDWANFLSGELVSFAPDERYFVSWRHPRLRGVAAIYWSETRRGSIGLTLFPPRQAVGPERRVVIQDGAPEVMLGRVARSDSAQPMEVAGAVSLMNLSPDGDWWIQLDTRLTAVISDVAEVEAYVHCVGIPERSYSRLVAEAGPTT